MKTSTRILLAGGLSLFLAALGRDSVRAQFPPQGAFHQAAMMQQMMNAQMMQANFARPIAPSFGMIPAVDPISGSFGSPFVQPLPSPGAGGMPFLPNPFDPGFINPYNPFQQNFNAFGPGFTLMGSADVMRAYGTVVTAQEQARLLREQYNQARLDTRKKAFDLNMYIRANTPTYTQEQERIARNTLRRIQTNSLPGEVANGKALNYLLNDLRKYPNKKIAIEPILLSEGVLMNLNVTKTTYGLGILRDEGRLNWPTAVKDQLTIEQKRDLETQVQALMKEAKKGPVDANVLKDVRNEIDRVRDDLVKKVNEIPTTQYLDAKRFLQEFHESTIALERGEAAVQAKFERFIEGGKSVQDVVEYMVENGLRFGPATAADEAAYRAVHSALASYNIAMNSHVALQDRD